jgi:hypothetical protein
MPDCDGTGTPGTEPSAARGLDSFGQPECGWSRRAFGSGRRAAGDLSDSGATARRQKGTCREKVGDLLTEEFERMKQTLSECLRGDAEELTEEVDRIERQVSEFFRESAKDEE